MYEAIHAKVPMITVPQYADQPVAAALSASLSLSSLIFPLLPLRHTFSLVRASHSFIFLRSS